MNLTSVSGSGYDRSSERAVAARGGGQTGSEGAPSSPSSRRTRTPAVRRKSRTRSQPSYRPPDATTSVTPLLLISFAQPKHGAPVQYRVEPARSSGDENSRAFASAWIAMHCS